MRASHRKCAWLAVSLMTAVDVVAKYFGRSVDVTDAVNDSVTTRIGRSHRRGLSRCFAGVGVSGKCIAAS